MTSGDTPSVEEAGSETSTLAGVGHSVLDILGLVPVFGEGADLANAVWYAGEGNYLDAGLSLISVIPVFGDLLGKGGKLVGRFGGKLGGKALDTLKTLNFPELLGKFRKNPKLGPHVEKIIKALENWRKSILDKFSNLGPPGSRTPCPKEALKSQQAAELLERAGRAEKEVTPALTSLAEQRGLKMEGLDFRLKSEDSLTRKLADTAPEDIRDALRYTMVGDPKDLASSVKTTLNALQDQGYEVLKVKNTFKPGAPYKGVNTQIKSPDGQVFELQFHTPQSYNVKQNLSHELYEKMRVLADKDPHKAELAEKLVRMSDPIASPEGLGQALKEFVR